MDSDIDHLADLVLRELEEDKLDRAHPEDAKAARFSVSATAGLESVFTSKLAIVVGHTQRKQGAIGVEPIEATEYVWNDKLSDQILLAAKGYGVDCAIFYRDGIGIAGAYEQVKDWNADTCIELHFNSASVVAKGTETLYGDNRISEPWANTIQNGMLNVLDRPTNENRGIKLRLPHERGGTSLSQLKDTPCVLVEPFFGHMESEAILASEKMNAYAKQLVESHLSFITVPA